MVSILTVFLVAIAIGVLLLAIVLFAECLLAALPPRLGAETDSGESRPSLAVLIPAHNEEHSISNAIQSVTPQLGPGDRLVVIADHCADRTAAIARATGARVVERSAPLTRGKSHALNQGLESLAHDPPEVVVMIDADCTVGSGSIERIARVAKARGRPTQSKNIIEPSASAGLMSKIAVFGFMVRNVVRPSGLARAGLPCLVTGTGLAIPWRLAGEVPPTEHLVDDRKWSIDLALAGYPPVYCLGAVVSSRLPGRPQAAWAQRRRWEHGHLATFGSEVPLLFAEAVRQRRWDLMALALDLAVPPLSLLFILGAGGLAISAVGAALGSSWIPTALLSAAAALMLAAVLAAWLKVGRASGCPLSVLLAAPVYVLKKIPLYGDFLFARQRAWEGRTGRDTDA